MRLHAFQLILNLLWSVPFFGLRSPGLAVPYIAVPAVSTLPTLVTDRRIRPMAGFLSLPYQTWMDLTSAPNFCIGRKR